LFAIAATPPRGNLAAAAFFVSFLVEQKRKEKRKRQYTNR
jgi:hypothetical protein